MLHELLLSLLGYIGDLIIDEREHHKSLGIHSPISHESTFKLSFDISFIQLPERVVIESLIKFGFYYRELDRFAAKSRDLSWIRSANITVSECDSQQVMKGNCKRQSVYRRAMANGVVKIFSIYRSAVLQVEQKLLSDPVPILATVTHGLNKSSSLLLMPSLCATSFQVLGKSTQP